MDFLLRLLIVVLDGVAKTLERLVELWEEEDAGSLAPAFEPQSRSEFAAIHLQFVWERLEAHDAEEC